VRRLVLVLLLALALALLAGCGGDSNDSESTTPTALTPAQNEIYERAFSECSSTDLDGLAGKYQTASPTVDIVAQAVGEAWSNRFGGGDEGEEIGAGACRDGINSRPDSSSSA
jgi:hypothetical protein